MRKIIIFVSTVLLASCITTALYYGAVKFRKYSQNRFSDIHAALSDDDQDSAPDDETTNEAQYQKRDNVVNPLKTIDGAISWKILAQAKLGEVTGSQDYALQGMFTPEIKNLNNKNIIVQGFMFPLDSNEKQWHFILSPYPVSCPYCMPAGPNELIDVYADKPIKFGYEPIALKGDFKLLTDSDQIKDGMLYQLKNAKIY